MELASGEVGMGGGTILVKMCELEAPGGLQAEAPSVVPPGALGPGGV